MNLGYFRTPYKCASQLRYAPDYLNLVLEKYGAVLIFQIIVKKNECAPIHIIILHFYIIYEYHLILLFISCILYQISRGE